ncbi:MAG: divalent-cation tolerance protein CutA [Alphaproteobacteria bacterium]|nr:divalent-cation tolerance protein CutA [Alphaproteobacteria bacterium]
MDDLHQPCLGYITAASVHDAQNLSFRLLQAGLIACANIMPGLTSVYRYQGKIETTAEVALLIKTTVARQSAIIDMVRHHHPYSLPCLIFLPITGGLPDFLEWIKSSCFLKKS